MELRVGRRRSPPEAFWEHPGSRRGLRLGELPEDFGGGGCPGELGPGCEGPSSAIGNVHLRGLGLQTEEQTELSRKRSDSYLRERWELWLCERVPPEALVSCGTAAGTRSVLRTCVWKEQIRSCIPGCRWQANHPQDESRWTKWVSDGSRRHRLPPASLAGLHPSRGFIGSTRLLAAAHPAVQVLPCPLPRFCLWLYLHLSINPSVGAASASHL